MRLNGIVLIVVALAIAAAYYSGSLSGFTARLQQLVANPQIAGRKVIPFPYSTRAARNVNARAV